ncbi:lipopolysaccharide transport periplasmic protein LptA [Vibrio fluvialis]|jgi:lipopolysaccharide export system protein LptA|uniref:Lipopolysaccharide export system protein LptA n=3 Tax=Vibrio TaxID=662 RepID=A0AAX2LL22_VIBFL|nr:MULTISPECIES: lipopolysaccharide transport periplasmic protein LptA [Vibrio]HDM8034117.1 lipopolysaccharide transport periplasmic protein LptA [Vibrio fluvialis clinical-1]AMF96068.1 lipopolysaccharide transport periplasmic protein LptA [Vibrio fluvialis]AVH32033.1 lipopolysaccharide transport periplasmic protein LptA [Vibrio fluvialis]EKO3368906.1 lipopolysaccharide transport periplasmic protein LptA [Vibrio fluvialis]EKO3373847.1 lipopolysaccharide transport periplasmic protein LptA [Vibr
MKLSHLSFLALLLASGHALALSSDSQQPVYIDSDSQQLDMKSSRVTFLGDVKLKQGSININADKLIVIRDAKTGKVQDIEGYGNLATFSQLTDDGKTLYGEAKELYYKMADDELTMIDQAMLSQDDSEIRGSKIRYKISSQKLIADSNGSGRVSTVLQPQATQQ